jgi:hypothetical protein
VTGRDLVSASLRLLGVYASGEQPSSEEATDGLAAFNRMISSWSNEKLLIYSITSETPFTLTPGDATVTMGTAGDFTNRPQEIMGALIRDGSTDYPVHLITLDEYTRIPNKSVQSTYPGKLYDDGGYPQRTLTLWPVPSAAKSLVLYTKGVLTTIATLDTSLSFPPGYERALVYCGALELAPEYGRTPSELVMAVATESKASIKRANTKAALVQCDEALLHRKTFDITTGDWRR